MNIIKTKECIYIFIIEDKQYILGDELHAKHNTIKS